MDLNAGIGSWYAGVGSRETPQDVLELMLLAATSLATDGWGVRSGGAPGADTAFEAGAILGGGEIEIYLPWPGFEGRDIGDYAGGRDHPSRDAFDLASRLHPAWERLSVGARALHARNGHQILGESIAEPVLARFVLCWTPDASGIGGTGQAIRVADHFEVPVFDLATAAVRERVTEYVTSETTL